MVEKNKEKVRHTISFELDNEDYKPLKEMADKNLLSTNNYIKTLIGKAINCP